MSAKIVVDMNSNGNINIASEWANEDSINFAALVHVINEGKLLHLFQASIMNFGNLTKNPDIAKAVLSMINEHRQQNKRTNGPLIKPSEAFKRGE